MWIHNLVAAVLVYELTNSALFVGLVSVAQFGPNLVLAPLSGAQADRGDRKQQIISGRVITASASGGLALWIWLAGLDGTVGAWIVVGTALVTGIGSVTGGPAMQAILPSLVRPNELEAAVAINSIPPTLGRAVGPAIGAAVAAFGGPAAAFAIASLGHIAFALMVMRLPIARHAVQRADGDHSAFGGLRYLRIDRTLIVLLMGTTAVGIGADPAITLSPSLSALLSDGPALVSIFATAFGIGAGLAFPLLPLLSRRLGRHRLAATGLTLMGIGMITLAVAASPQLAAVGFAIAGIGMTLAIISLSTQLQQRVPDYMRGRIMALWSVAFLGSRPLAGAVNGAVADVLTVEAALTLVAAICLLAAFLCRPSRLAAPIPIGAADCRPSCVLSSEQLRCSCTDHGTDACPTATQEDP